MSNLGAALKTEITRLARKEMRVHVDPLRKANAKLRGEIAGLKKVVKELERNAVAGARRQRSAEARPTDAVTVGSRARISSKGIKALRSKLGLSAEKFGKLVGATGQAVYNWEGDNAKPTGDRLQALLALRGLGKREVQKRLESLN